MYLWIILYNTYPSVLYCLKWLVSFIFGSWVFLLQRKISQWRNILTLLQLYSTENSGRDCFSNSTDQICLHNPNQSYFFIVLVSESPLHLVFLLFVSDTSFCFHFFLSLCPPLQLSLLNCSITCNHSTFKGRKFFESKEEQIFFISPTSLMTPSVNRSFKKECFGNESWEVSLIQVWPSISSETLN